MHNTEPETNETPSEIVNTPDEESIPPVNEWQIKAKELEESWIRAKAETENVRKRCQLDIAQARKFALESFASELLAVMDSLNAALQVTETTVESYRSGVELTARQLSGVFEKFHIESIHPENEKFDPNKHQAIAAIEHPDAAPNTVVSVMQKGYALHERILRPALVTVVKSN